MGKLGRGLSFEVGRGMEMELGMGMGMGLRVVSMCMSAGWA